MFVAMPVLLLLVVLVGPDKTEWIDVPTLNPLLIHCMCKHIVVEPTF